MFEVGYHYGLFPWDERIRKLSEKQILWLYIMIKRKEYQANKIDFEKTKLAGLLANPFISPKSDRSVSEYSVYNPYFEEDLKQIGT